MRKTDKPFRLLIVIRSRLDNGLTICYVDVAFTYNHMKKPFFAILSGLVLGSALAQADVSLLYSYDFETFDGSLNSLNNNNLSATPGTGSFNNTYADNTFINWSSGALGSTLAYETKPAAAS